MIKKIYTNEEYANLAQVATQAKQMLYIYTFEPEPEPTPEPEDGEEVTEAVETVEAVEETPEEPTTDDYGQEIVPYEPEPLLYATLKIAPIGYYVCYKDNYTDGTINENYEAEKQAATRAYLDSLSLTAADVERAIYKAKGIDFEDLIRDLEDNPLIDVKALKIELNANNFYRNHPYIAQIGALLGFSSDDLDYLFLHKTFPENKE